MPRYKVLVSPNTLLPVIDQYRSLLEDNNIEIIIPPTFNEYLSETELLPLVSNIDGAICGDDQFTEKVLKSAKNLKVLSKWGEGLNAIDLRAAKNRNVKVFRTAGALTDPVADTIMAYILAFARNIIEKDYYMKNREWRKLSAVTLKESVLGIIGYGKIGQAVAKRSISFGMKVITYDVKIPKNDLLVKTNTELVTFKKLLSESDFISLNCDLNESSYRIINHDALKEMKANSILINTARGELIDESALINALKSRIIFGAALDVFEKEPLSKDSELRTMKNCLLSAHNANSSPLVFDYIHRKTIENLINGLVD